MNDGSCMMLPNKYGTMIRVPQEHRKPVSFKKKEIEMMQNYVDVGIGNYVIFNIEKLNLLKQNEKNISKVSGKCHLVVPALSLELEMVLISKVLNLAFTHLQSY